MNAVSDNDNRASREWATRPDDQRFETLEALKASVLQRRHESWTATPKCEDMQARPLDGNGFGSKCSTPRRPNRRLLTPTNFAFGQLCGYAKAPASYLRSLPSELTAINLQWGLEHMRCVRIRSFWPRATGTTSCGP